MENTIEKVVESVLIQNRINSYNKRDLESQLKIHPNYPSFYSITDTLDYFNIENVAAEVPKEVLDQLPKSFISLVKIDKAEEIVIVNQGPQKIQLKHSSLKHEHLNRSEFKKIWIPKIIAVDPNEKSNQKDFNSIFQNSLLILLCAGIFILFSLKPWNINSIFFLLLTIAGSIFSFFAVKESLGLQSQTMHQFCTSVGKSNCGDVINSVSGKLFANISIADTSLVYFLSLLTFIIFFGFNTILIYPALLGIPVVGYTIYSQAFKIKKWCAICITIASISLGLAIIAILNFSIQLDILSITNLVVTTSIITLFYSTLKKKLIDNKDYKNENIRLKQFKRNPKIFNHFYRESEKINDNTDIKNEIVLGNPNATFKIIGITNPMCGFCKDAFEAYVRTFRSLGEEVQIIIRMKVQITDLEKDDTQISMRLSELYQTQGTEIFIEAYMDWLANKSTSTWFKKYGSPQNAPSTTETLHHQLEWARENNLNYTPATLINNRVYPKKTGMKISFIS